MRQTLSIIVGLIALVLGVVRLSQYFVLPGCDSSRTTDTMRDILRERSIVTISFEDVRTLSEGKDEFKCQARFDATNSQHYSTDYRVFWEGWTVKVSMTWRPVAAVAPAPAAQPPKP